MDRGKTEIAKLLASKIGPDELQEILNALEGMDDADKITEYMGLAFEWHLEQGNYPSDWQDLDTGIYRLETHFDEQGHPHGTDIVNGEIVRY